MEKRRNMDLNLSHAEFAYNNFVNRSTGRGLFKIVHGLSLRQPIDLLPLPTDYHPFDYA